MMGRRTKRLGWGKKRPQPTTVGLDVGAGAIKAVEVAHDGDAPEVIRLGFRHVPTGAWLTADGLPAHEVVDAISDLWAVEGFSRREVVCAVGGEVLKIFDPEARTAPINPLEPETLIWQVADFKSGDLQDRRRLAIGAERARIQAICTLLERAGIRADVLDAHPLALTNALVSNHPEAREGCVGLIDLGQESACVVVLDEGIPIIVRHLPTEPLPRTPPYPFSSDEKVAVVSEILLVFEQILASRQALPETMMLDDVSWIGQLFVCGGGFMIPGILQQLANEIDLPIRTVNPFQSFPVGPGGEGQASLHNEHLLFMQALGLAMRRH